MTHELRSPIASARLHVESLQLGRVPEAKRERYLNTTLADLDRLSRTVDRIEQHLQDVSQVVRPGRVLAIIVPVGGD